MMKNKIQTFMKSFLTLTALFIVVNGFTQDTKNTVGLRFGDTWGITYQAFIQENKGFEGLLGFRDGGVQFYGLFQHYRPAFNEYTDHFYWYYGVGGHAGFVSWEDYDDDPYGHYFHHISPVLGVDGNVGLEFWFYRIPLAIGLDYKPFLELFGHHFLKMNFWDCAFTIKYTF
jgi:hypothetical protein